MLLLMLFALVAGAGTAITPCVIPVLPALFSASALGGRRRPLGIIVGLALTFTIAIVALAQIAKGVGLASGATRTLAVIVLVAFGLVMLVPELAERVQAPLSRLARFGPRSRGSGFWSGLLVGAALGFVCAPCAGPILAAVISVSASGNTSARVVAVAIGYVAGLSAVLTIYSIGGRRVMDLVRRKAAATWSSGRSALSSSSPASSWRPTSTCASRKRSRAPRACPRSSPTRPARSRARTLSRTASPRCAPPLASP
ncbi:MAG: cytochrome c biogenesis CcdA family protein, partial [Actinomycetota bacterium]|nr:cytochrome c biogenesis CcdA family protein [Actinomycetota bacterium]